MSDIDAATRAKLAARPLARNLHTDDDRARANAWMIRAQNALTAVLDLHTPDSWGDDQRPHCTECSGNAGVRIWAPCDTVRAVAEKLGVSPTT